MKTVRHFEIQDGGHQVHFWRGNDPQKFCLLQIWQCTKFHAFIIKCTIFSHICPTMSRGSQCGDSSSGFRQYILPKAYLS